MPTSWRSSAAGSTTCRAYVPNARRRTAPSSGSRRITGFCVPHVRSVSWRVVTK
ncbi:Uncharacterised protein [Mycobacteroides abscessus]|nr:Uncharacterised protein [Mycobacteroides abscessus]